MLSVTSEYEILRGDMARILYGTTKDTPGIKYVFDESIATIKENADGKVYVTFANNSPPATFDLVVGADGMTSRTRRMIFGHGPKNDDYLNRLGQYSAYFTISRTNDDTEFAQWWNATRGRLILKRPDRYGTTRVYMSVTDANLARFDEIDCLLKDGDQKAQQAWFEKEFQGAGWLTERCVKGMKESGDFYMQQIAQVKMEKWSKGRVVLVGDAAYAPSPISGVVCLLLSTNVIAYIHPGNRRRHRRRIRPRRRDLALTRRYPRCFAALRSAHAPIRRESTEAYTWRTADCESADCMGCLGVQ